MIGKSILHYKIREQLGQGGMGIVYLAEDTKLDRKVAIKFLPHHISANSDERKRLEIEAKAAAALNHPNIATIYAIEEVDEKTFLVMEYIEGQELKEIVGTQHVVPQQEAIDLALQIAEGLQAAHEKGIIHRDIKSSNIMVTNDGKVKIMDFGLAKIKGVSKLTQSGTTLGTISYMSPEQASGKNADHRSDIWSFGVVLYEMFTGQLPFTGDYDQAVVYSIINEEPQSVKKLNPEIPVELVNIIKKALRKNTDARYNSFVQIIKDLKNCLENLNAEDTNIFNLKMLMHRFGKVKVAITLILLILLIALGVTWYLNWRADILWAREQTMPKIRELVENSWRDYTEAYAMEIQAEKYIPDNPELINLIKKSSLNIHVNSEPANAKVYYKPYNAPDNNWKYAGKTPLIDFRIPIGVFRWKFVKEGYDTVFAAASSWNLNLTQKNLLIPNNIDRKLDKTGDIPPGMVRVKGAKTRFGQINDFFIDKFEVTKKQYKVFVDSGGYSNQKFWNNDFIKDGKKLTWQQAMKLFVDQTGRPGPANWQAGDYPHGQDNYPVSGISWFEAAAYAKFAKKELPTGMHWGLARGESTPLIIYPQLGGFAIFAPFSNFLNNGLVAVGSLKGVAPYGELDMAGNVREWCWNKTKLGRLIRGGAWNDNPYMFTRLSQDSPFNRSERNGFRCVVYADREKIPAEAFNQTFVSDNKFYSDMKPVPDDIFRVYKEQFSYDKAELNTSLDSTDDHSKYWIHERVSYNAAYNNERIIAHLFLPKNALQPYEAVLYFPGSVAVYQTSSNDMENYYEFQDFVSYIVKNGRAVLFPVYDGTFERHNNNLSPALWSMGKLHQYTEYQIKLVKDIERSLDYLETRDDIDTSKIAFYGISWGGSFGTIAPALDSRIKTNVLISSGMLNIGLPEVNQLNYITRVKIPTLMLNGIYDMILPYDKAIKPAFDLLGTPAKDKQLKLYDTDHIPPKREFIKETLNWLDRYLGPVQNHS